MTAGGEEARPALPGLRWVDAPTRLRDIHTPGVFAVIWARPAPPVDLPDLFSSLALDTSVVLHASVPAPGEAARAAGGALLEHGARLDDREEVLWLLREIDLLERCFTWTTGKAPFSMRLDVHPDGAGHDRAATASKVDRWHADSTAIRLCCAHGSLGGSDLLHPDDVVDDRLATGGRGPVLLGEAAAAPRTLRVPTGAPWVHRGLWGPGPVAWHRAPRALSSSGPRLFILFERPTRT